MTKNPSPVFSSFLAFSSFLEAKGLFCMTPGLEHITASLEALGLIRPEFAVVQIVGTNGKGSTSTMLAQLAKEHGFRVGVHTSPHFVSFTERVTINAQPLPEEEWLACADLLASAGGDALSYFEYITALALLAFSRANVDLAVMETGLGGTWDATTAVAADLVLFTPIDLDHVSVLGNTRAIIAKDKAGAMRLGVPALSAMQPRDVWSALAEEARNRNVPLFAVTEKGTEIPAYLSSQHVSLAWPAALDQEPETRPSLGLVGNYQYINAAVALAGWRYLRAAFFEEAAPGALEERDIPTTIATSGYRKEELAGLASAWLPGRFQLVPASSDYTLAAPKAFSRPFLDAASGETIAEFPVSGAPVSMPYPPMILDGAHNVHGLSHLGHILAQRNIAPLAVIFACLQDKDVAQMVVHVRSFATGALFIPPIKNNPRAMPPGELAACIGVNAYPTASLEEALYLASAHMVERMPEIIKTPSTAHPLLVCGSLYLLSELYTLRPDLLISPFRALPQTPSAYFSF